MRQMNKRKLNRLRDKLSFNRVYTIDFVHFEKYVELYNKIESPLYRSAFPLSLFPHFRQKKKS
jgi:hypothetical protein